MTRSTVAPKAAARRDRRGVAAPTGRGPIDVRLLRHARSSRRGVAVLVLLGAAQTAATLATAAALTLLVVSFTGQAGQAGLPGHAGAVGLLGGAFATRAVLSWAEQVAARRTASRAADELRRAVLAAALRHGPAWVAGYGSGRLSALLGGGLDALRPWFGSYLPALVLAATLPPCVLAVMAVVDPASAAITLVTLPLIPVFGALIGWVTRARAQRRWAADARLAGHFLDVVRGLATLRLFGRAHRQIAVVRDMTERHRAATMGVLRLAFLSSTALDLVGTLSVGLVAVQVGLRVAAGDLALGPALLVILLAPEAYRPLREVAARYHAAADATAVIADVDEVLTAPPDTHRSINTGAAPGLSAAGLRVRHPGAAVDALALPGLTVRAGEVVALRGPSGAGKTTALRVLAGLQAPYAGHVRLSGPRPLYLPQRPTLPHARTVRQALALDDMQRRPGPPAGTAPHGAGPHGAGPHGAGPHEAEEAEVAWALRAAGLDGEIAALPFGLDTPLGEHGRGVSSGQRQRIALARLLRQARRGPSVLLLDEPTAHLDTVTEALVIAQLRDAAARGCAVLVVAHRSALLAAADRLVTVNPPMPRDARPSAAQAGIPQGKQSEGSAAQRLQGTYPTGDPAPASPRGEQSKGPTTPPPPATSAAGGPAGAATCGPVGPALRRGAAAVLARGGTAVALGAASSLAGLVLTGAAGWLLVRASTLPPILTLSTAVVLVRAGAVARPLLRYAERLVSHEVAFARLGTWRAGVYADLVPRVPGVLSHRRGELLTRAIDDVDARIDGLLRGRLPVAATGAALAVGVAGAAVLLPAAGAMLAAGVAVAAVLAPALAARHADRVDARTGAARAALRDAVVETVDALEELASRDEAAALSVPQRRSRALSVLEEGAARSAGAATALAHLSWGAAVTGVAAVLSGAGVGGPGAAISAEIAAVLLLGAVALGEPVPSLTDAAIARRRAAGARARLAAIAAQPTTNRSTETRTIATRPIGGRLSGAWPGMGLVVSGLAAGWDPLRGPALRGLDLVVPAGGRVAIRGPSGGGKSTLAAVLVGLLDPRAGSVTLGDKSPGHNGAVCLVGDEADHVFASTVRENLRLARPGAGDDELREMLARVRLGGWLAALPDGLDTWLGEGAGTVSGGERRRLATARALLADPGLLVLDEPTEGLDTPTAAALTADLLTAAGGRTVLLLTHRVEGLAHVDAVHELVGGRLVRAGEREVSPRRATRTR